MRQLPLPRFPELIMGVRVRHGEIKGKIVEVNDPDQGDFEFYVKDDDGSGSYWPGEYLELIT